MEAFRVPDEWLPVLMPYFNAQRPFDGQAWGPAKKTADDESAAKFT
jgi:cytolysin (calcineurin-like family phosphatase)